MLNSFEEFVASTSMQIPISIFIINLFLTASLTFILSKVYQHYGTTLSNRKLFGKNLTLIAMTTMLIISVVKSSLALSLGLVGALSIIRFRTAIKEPEELAYLFLTISLGLGFGANQRLITVIAFFFIILVLIVYRKLSDKEESANNLYLTIKTEPKNDIQIKDIIEILEPNCNFLKLTRLDENDEVMEVSFIIDFEDIGQLSKCKDLIYELNKNFSFSILENKLIN